MGRVHFSFTCNISKARQHPPLYAAHAFEQTPFHIAIIRGGYTGESVISLQSAATLMEPSTNSATRRFTLAFLARTGIANVLMASRWNLMGDDSPLFRGHGMEVFNAALIAIHTFPEQDSALKNAGHDERHLPDRRCAVHGPCHEQVQHHWPTSAMGFPRGCLRVAA